MNMFRRVNHVLSYYVSFWLGRGLKIACLEEIALSNGWINPKMLELSISEMGQSESRSYLENLLKEPSYEE